MYSRGGRSVSIAVFRLNCRSASNVGSGPGDGVAVAVDVDVDVDGSMLLGMVYDSRMKQKSWCRVPMSNLLDYESSFGFLRFVLYVCDRRTYSVARTSHLHTFHLGTSDCDS